MLEIAFILITILAFGLIIVGQLSDKNINLIAFFLGAALLFFGGIALYFEGVDSTSIKSIPVTLDANGNIEQYTIEYPTLNASNDSGMAMLSFLYFALGFIFFLIGGVELGWRKTTLKILDR